MPNSVQAQPSLTNKTHPPPPSQVPHSAVYAASVNPPRRAKKVHHGPVDSAQPRQEPHTEASRSAAAVSVDSTNANSSSAPATRADIRPTSVNPNAIATASPQASAHRSSPYNAAQGAHQSHRRVLLPSPEPSPADLSAPAMLSRGPQSAAAGNAERGATSASMPSTTVSASTAFTTEPSATSASASASGPKKRGRKPLGGGPASTRAARESARRANHSRIEKARRLKINGALEALRVLVPNDVDSGSVAAVGEDEDEEDAEDMEYDASDRTSKKKKGDASTKWSAGDRSYKLDVLERTVLFVRTLMARVQTLEAEGKEKGKAEGCTCRCVCDNVVEAGAEANIYKETEANRGVSPKRKRGPAAVDADVEGEGRKKRRGAPSQEAEVADYRILSENEDAADEDEDEAADRIKEGSPTSFDEEETSDVASTSHAHKDEVYVRQDDNNNGARPRPRLPSISALLAESDYEPTSPALETNAYSRSYGSSAFPHAYLTSPTMGKRSLHSNHPNVPEARDVHGLGGYISPRHSTSPMMSASRSPGSYTDRARLLDEGFQNPPYSRSRAQPYAHVPSYSHSREREPRRGSFSSASASSSPGFVGAGARAELPSHSPEQYHHQLQGQRSPASPYAYLAAQSAASPAHTEQCLPTPPASGRTRASSVGMATARALAAAPLRLPAAASTSTSTSASREASSYASASVGVDGGRHYRGVRGAAGADADVDTDSDANTNMNANGNADEGWHEGAASLVLLQMRTCVAPPRSGAPPGGMRQILNPKLDRNQRHARDEAKIQEQGQGQQKQKQRQKAQAQTPGSLLGIPTRL